MGLPDNSLKLTSLSRCIANGVVRLRRTDPLGIAQMSFIRLICVRRGVRHSFQLRGTVPEIETHRLRLRAIAFGDLPALARLWGDPEVMTCLPTGEVRSVEATRAELHGQALARA